MSFYTHSRSEMLEFIPQGCSRVIDIGCASGSFGATLRADRPSLDALWGIEPDPGAAELARAYYDHVVVGNFPGAVSSLPVEGFDCVLLNDVLEHIVDPVRALQAAKGLLSSDGVVVASIPNVRHTSALLPLLLRGEWNYTDVGVLDRTHVRFFTRSSIAVLFEEAGYTVDRLCGINAWYPRLGTARRLLRGRLDDFVYLQYAVVARPKIGSKRNAEASEDALPST